MSPPHRTPVRLTAILLFAAVLAAPSGGGLHLLVPASVATSTNAGMVAK